jgi:CBS domain-containing protein
MDVRTLLAKQRRGVHTISQGLTVEDAVRLMTEQRTPALIVLEGEKPIGILTEGDILRSYVKCNGRFLGEIGIADVMTTGLIVAQTHDQVGACLAMMLQSDIGCLPVVEDGRIVGMFYLRDLLQHQIEELTAELDMLHGYVASLQDAIRD